MPQKNILSMIAIIAAVLSIGTASMVLTLAKVQAQGGEVISLANPNPAAQAKDFAVEGEGLFELQCNSLSSLSGQE